MQALIRRPVLVASLGVDKPHSGPSAASEEETQTMKALSLQLNVVRFLAAACAARGALTRLRTRARPTKPCGTGQDGRFSLVGSRGRCRVPVRADTGLPQRVHKRGPGASHARTSARWRRSSRGPHTLAHGASILPPPSRGHARPPLSENTRRAARLQEADALAALANYDVRPPAADGQHQVWTLAKSTSFSFLVETETEFQPSFERAQQEAEVRVCSSRGASSPARAQIVLTLLAPLLPSPQRRHCMCVCVCVALPARVAPDPCVPATHATAVGPRHGHGGTRRCCRDPRGCTDRPVCLPVRPGARLLRPLPARRCGAPRAASLGGLALIILARSYAPFSPPARRYRVVRAIGVGAWVCHHSGQRYDRQQPSRRARH